MSKKSNSRSGVDTAAPESEDMQRRLALFERSERLARVGHFELDKQNHRLLYCSPGSAALLDVNNKDLLAEDG